MIYHYTSIETLKRILESGKIRFNNLNAVDDELEGELFLKKSLAQLIFVSCWTTDPEENIPLWDMYATTRGVRIGVPEYPWRKIDCKKWDTGLMDARYDEKEYYSPFDIHEIYGKRHFILPPFNLALSNSDLKKAFSKHVIYLSEDDLKAKYSSHYREKPTKPGHVELFISPLEFGLYKHERWAFQKEFRFVLFISPMDKEINLYDNNIHESMVDSLMKYVQAEWESPIKDFFVTLDPASIANMEITLGPHCTEEDIQTVLTLRKKYGVTGKVLKSGVRIRKR